MQAHLCRGHKFRSLTLLLATVQARLICTMVMVPLFWYVTPPGPMPR